MGSTFRPLSLSEFEISPEQGFLPQDPRKEVADCAPLNAFGRELPKLLSARIVRSSGNLLPTSRRRAGLNPPTLCST